MVHSAKKKIRKHRGVDESPLNNEVLNAILLVSKVFMYIIIYICSFFFPLFGTYKTAKVIVYHERNNDVMLFDCRSLFD